MKLRELLGMRGFDLSARAKVIRHLDPYHDVLRMRRDGWLETYQQYNSPGVLESCDYTVSFVTEPDGSVRLFGVFAVGGWSPSEAHPTPSGFPYPQAANWGRYFELQRLAGFEDLVGRLVIRWSGRSWHRWLNSANDWEVTEILPAGFVRPFPGYLEVLVSFEDLRRIVANPAVHRDWHGMLSAPGIYLITDTLTGQQYVGSATGARGLIGRWAAYARDGHGGNVRLRSLLRDDPDYARNFQFSILRTLPPELHRQDGIRHEQLYKAKLGARAHGLNET